MRKSYFYTLLLVFSLGIISFFSSCTSSTLITSEPKGAKLYIDSEYVGDTPYVMADQKFTTTCTQIKIEKTGFETINTQICKDEQIDIGAAISGVFLYIPWLWILGYSPVHEYTLKSTANNDYYYLDNNASLNNVQSNPPAQSNTKVQKLRDLKQLLDEGIITTEEYNTEKKKILEQEEW